MAIRTTSQAGPWSSSSTWGGSSPPGSGDRAIITYAITGASGTVGTSPVVDQVGAGTIESSGFDIIGSGTSFTTQLSRGCLIVTSGGRYAFVESVTDNTHCTINRDLSGGYAIAANSSYTFTPMAIYQTGTGASLAVSGALVVQGDWGIHYPSSSTRADVVTVAAGAGIEFDSSLASSPSTTHYRLLPQGAPSQDTRIVLNGVAGNRTYFRSNSGGGNAYWEHYESYRGGYLYARYCDFTRLGTATIPALTVESILADSCFDLAECVFDTCGELGRNASHFGVAASGAVCSLVNVTWKNSLGAHCTDLPAGSTDVSFVIKGCISDKNVRGRFSYWTVGGPGSDDWCLFSGISGIDSVGAIYPYSNLFQSILKRNTTEANEFICPGTLQDCYILNDLDPTPSNAHPCFLNGSAPHDVLRCIFETVKNDPNCDILLFPGSAVISGTWNAKFNIVLPDSTNAASGTWTFYGGDGGTYVIEHNTIHLGGDIAGGPGGVQVGESYGGHTSMIVYRSNILRDVPGRILDYAYNISPINFAATVVDIINPSDYGPNAVLNAGTGTHNQLNGVADQTRYGFEYTKWSTATPPAASAIATEPAWVWQNLSLDRTELGIAGWAGSLGSTGTKRQRIDSAIAELSKKNDVSGYDARYNLFALMTWIRNLHRPTNSAYASATYSGDTATLDAAGNTLNGTIGAMAYQAAVPALDLTGWLSTFNFPLTHYLGLGWDLGENDHYDVLRCLQNARDYVEENSGDPSTWDAVISAAISRNRDNYTLANGGATNGWSTWNWGLCRHWERTGDPLSRAEAIQDRRLAAITADEIPQWRFDLTTWGGSREGAFALLSHLGGEDAGHPPTARIHALAEFNIKCIDEWTDVNRSYYLYVQSFMVGLTIEALIAYWDRYRNHPSCPVGIPAKIKSALDLLWNSEWDVANQAFLYSDVDGPTAYAVVFSGSVASVGANEAFSIYSCVTILGNSSLSSQDNYYTYGWLKFTSGALSGTNCLVLNYTGSTRKFLLYLFVQPSPGDTFEIRQYQTGGNPFDGGPGPAQDTNLLIAPGFMWYALYSGDDTYRVKFDEGFAGSAAGLGAIAQQKVWNECYRWSFQALKWRDHYASPWPAETALTFTAPDGLTGRASAWSGRLKVALSGSRTAVSGPVTITITDTFTSDSSPAGGTFRGNPILTTDHRLTCFCYRPPAGSSGRSITFTITSDDPSLNNPASLTYTVSGEATVATGFIVTGPSSGPLDAESAPFTLSLIPTNGVLPADFDAIGGVADIYTTDTLTNTDPFGYGSYALKISGNSSRYASNIPLTDELTSWQFTYLAPTVSGIYTGPYPGTTSLGFALYGNDPQVWAAPAALTYTAPAPPARKRLRVRIGGTGTLTVRSG